MAATASRGVFWFAYAGTVITLPFFLKVVMELPTSTIGLILAAEPVIAIIFNPLANLILTRGWFGKNSGPKLILMGSLVLLITQTLFLFIEQQSIPLIAVAVFLQGISSSGSTSAFSCSLSDNLPKGIFSTLWGVVMLIINVSYTVGMAISLTMVENFSNTKLNTYFYTFLFLFGIAVFGFFCSSYLYYLLTIQNSKTQYNEVPVEDEEPDLKKVVQAISIKQDVKQEQEQAGL